MSADGMIPTMGRAELGSAEPTEEEGSSALQTGVLRLDPVSLMFTDRLNPRLGLGRSRDQLTTGMPVVDVTSCFV